MFGFFPVDVPTVIFLGMFSVMLAALAAAVITAVKLLRAQQRKAKMAGYASLSAYLQAPPRTDLEKRDAVDLALKGLVICLLGLIFPPLLLVGLVPFFYGARKIVYSSMGLGLVDDADGPNIA